MVVAQQAAQGPLTYLPSGFLSLVSQTLQKAVGRRKTQTSNSTSTVDSPTSTISAYLLNTPISQWQVLDQHATKTLLESLTTRSVSMLQLSEQIANSVLHDARTQTPIYCAVPQCSADLFMPNNRAHLKHLLAQNRLKGQLEQRRGFRTKRYAQQMGLGMDGGSHSAKQQQQQRDSNLDYMLQKLKREFDTKSSSDQQPKVDDQIVNQLRLRLGAMDADQKTKLQSAISTLSVDDKSGAKTGAKRLLKLPSLKVVLMLFSFGLLVAILCWFLIFIFC